MKRILLGLFIAVSIASAPFSIKTTMSTHDNKVGTSPTQSLSLGINSALAADACPNGVELSVKINKNDDPCLSGDDIIIKYVVYILRFLIGGIGLVILLMLVVAGIQYITANGQPANITKAKDRIKNAITALILFAAMTAILQFIIPGGLT